MEPDKTTVQSAPGSDPDFYRRRQPGRPATSHNRGGCPPKPIDFEKVRRLDREGVKLHEAARILGVSTDTLRRRTRRWLEEQRLQD